VASGDDSHPSLEKIAFIAKDVHHEIGNRPDRKVLAVLSPRNQPEFARAWRSHPHPEDAQTAMASKRDENANILPLEACANLISH
jgi:hypothetical protein